MNTRCAKPCPVTGKVSFRSEGGAKLGRAFNRKKGRWITYFCPHCKFYHLSTSPERRYQEGHSLLVE
jgi:hypothetical protein